MKMSIKEFVVVEFLKDKTVEVVHCSWLEKVGGDHICYWPKMAAGKQARAGEKPDKSKWKKRSVRLMSSTDTYAKANQYARREEESSNVKSQEDLGKKLKKRPSDSDRLDDEAVDVFFDFLNQDLIKPTKPTPVSTLPKSPSYTALRASPNSESVKHDLQTDLQTLASPSGRNTSSIPSRSSIVDESLSESFQVRVLMKLDNLLEDQIYQKSLLRMLVTNQDYLNEIEDLLPEPLNSEKQLLALCDRISKEQSFKKNMTAYLASFGGASLGASVRRMMRKIGKNELWSKYSLKGRKGKNKFEDLPICRLVISASMKNHPNMKIADVEAEITETLKHAPNKDGGKNKKLSTASEGSPPAKTLYSSSEDE
uniref:uncharacterized protein isoform X2 n=2 Tax=Myxine glutinosa TaxID=7769 RepID=UPI00359017EE